MDVREFTQGWRVLLLAVIGITVSINAVLLYGFGTLVVPFEEAFGWTRAQQQASITFLYGGAVVGLQLVGVMNRRFGVRRVTLWSLVAMAAGYLGCTQLIGGSIWTLYLSFALLPVVGMGALAVTWTQLINLWFFKNRGLALAIGLSGTGITAAVTPTVMAWSIAHFSWQAPFVMLAGLNLLLCPLALLWFKVPEKAQVSADAKSAADSQTPAAEGILGGMSFRQGLASKKFWICNLSLCLVVSSVVGLVTNTIPILHDRGFSTLDASYIFSFFGFSLIAGRLVVGYLLDRLWPPAVAAVSLLLPGVGCALFLSGTDSYLLLAFSVALFGFGAGAEFDIAAYLIARYFGLADYARLFGLHQGLITVATALAPLGLAAMYSVALSYGPLLTYCAGSTAVGALLLLSLGKPPRFTAGATDPA